MHKALRLLAALAILLCTVFFAGGYATLYWNGRANAAGDARHAKLARGQNGDIALGALINGAKVPMVLDTGATSVILTLEAARAAGLPLEVLRFTVPMDTANGATFAAPVTLDRLTIGAISERGVPALVVQHGQLRTSLLGMSFLNRLKSWEVRDDAIALHAYP